ncbi:MAG: hypothetical protein JNM40_22305 [Myxococcales bacterium]|nr:hypothetical protein [Myxococcales bacterium]
METNQEAPKQAKSLEETCVEQAQKLFAQAEQLGKEGKSFAMAGADLLATAQRASAPRQIEKLLSFIPMVAALLMTERKRTDPPPPHIEPGPIELRQQEIRSYEVQLEQQPENQDVQEQLAKLRAEQAAEMKKQRLGWFVGDVIAKASARLRFDLVEELKDLVRENRNGELDDAIKELLTVTAPIRFERIERLAQFLESPVIAGFDFGEE